jgi:hypothetical protein
MPRVHYEELCVTTDGPRAVVRTCKACRAAVHVRHKVQGAGRGAGMREGNKGNGLALAHWKREHADELAALMQRWGCSAAKKAG